MKIASILKPDAICAELGATEKMGVLRELAHKLAQTHAELDEARILKALVDRERLGSTGIGGGIAIPHAKLAGLNNIYAAFGRSHAGIDFDGTDDQPAHLFFLLIAPAKTVGRHLAALERASRLLQNENTRRRLLDVDADALFSTICEADEKG